MTMYLPLMFKIINKQNFIPFGMSGFFLIISLCRIIQLYRDRNHFSQKYYENKMNKNLKQTQCHSSFVNFPC